MTIEQQIKAIVGPIRARFADGYAGYKFGFNSQQSDDDHAAILALIDRLAPVAGAAETYTRDSYRPEAKYDLERFHALELNLIALRDYLEGGASDV